MWVDVSAISWSVLRSVSDNVMSLIWCWVEVGVCWINAKPRIAIQLQQNLQWVCQEISTATATRSAKIVGEHSRMGWYVDDGNGFFAAVYAWFNQMLMTREGGRACPKVCIFYQGELAQKSQPSCSKNVPSSMTILSDCMTLIKCQPIAINIDKLLPKVKFWWRLNGWTPHFLQALGWSGCQKVPRLLYVSCLL